MTHSQAGKIGWLKSKAIRDKKHSAFITRYENNPKKCLKCFSPIPYEKKYNKFCSSSCAAKFNKNSAKRKPKHLKACLNCGKIKNKLVRFCSNKCFQEHKYKTYIEKWLKGSVNATISDGLSVANPVYRFFREKQKGRCAICGLAKWLDKPMPLILDHINGDPLNSTVDNLRMVCGNCDMLLPTSRGKNRGNGRKARKYEKVS